MEIRHTKSASLRTRTLRFIEQLKSIAGSFSKTERALFIVALLVLVITTMSILGRVNQHFMITRPAHGGSVSEGIIGTPRFINPLLATSDADNDLTTLVYSGLMRSLPDGSLVPDLAENYNVSEDGLTYTFILKTGLTFHDKEPLTADDIVFTIESAKDPAIKSPKQIQWEGVEVSKTDDQTVTFTLKQPYAAFLEHTTLGILPAHLWNSVSVDEFALSDLNINAVGSGPYQLESIKKKSGVPEYYTLHAFKNFALGEPYISKLITRFYTNENEAIDDITSGTIDSIGGIEPDTARMIFTKNVSIESATLPRVFGIFFNQNQNPLLEDKTIVSAIELALDKEKIVEEVLSGYGRAINSPLGASPEQPQYDPVAAAALLAEDGWEKNDRGILEQTNSKKVTTELSFTISTGDTPELKHALEIVTDNLTALGIAVTPKIFEASNLNQEVIRPRKYDALFFGEIVQNPADLFAFWHSSQRTDPGLNIALYANTKVDTLLEDAATELDPETRELDYASAEAEIMKDMPAVFLYAPAYIYIHKTDIRNITLAHLKNPKDRFSTIHTWYIKTYKIWKIFDKTQK